MFNLECRYVQQFKAIYKPYNITQDINKPTRVMSTFSASFDLISSSDTNLVTKHETLYQTYRDFKHVEYKEFFKKIVEILLDYILYVEQKLYLINYFI